MVALPVIVVDGLVFEARLEEEDILLREVGVSRVHWRGAEFAGHPFPTFDVVRADRLDDFATQRASDTRILLDAMRAAANVRRPSS